MKITKMTEAELIAQRKQARARLDLAKLHKRSGKATADEVEQAQLAYDALNAYQIPPEAPKAAADATNAPVMVRVAVSEFQALLDDLSGQYAQARKNQALLSNQLAAIPPEQNALALVDQIQAAKVIRLELGTKIGYLKAHGTLPAVVDGPAADRSPEVTESAFLASLPADRYELNKMLVNVLQPKLYRRKQALAKAKKPSYIAEYAKEVARLELEIELVKRQMAAAS